LTPTNSLIQDAAGPIDSEVSFNSLSTNEIMGEIFGNESDCSPQQTSGNKSTTADTTNELQSNPFQSGNLVI